MIGQSIGSYRIVAKVGEGGMGEVYRAHDTKLHRDVALKVLIPSVAHDPERLARFSREAQVLASLNHPHIAQVYGLEDFGGASAIVMEFVEGPTLADRLARGAIPADEALPIARQIALALEAAHEHGVVHRDLKPANVKIRPDGTAKVLDFGLAKALETGPSSPTSDHQPTVTSPAVTAPGVILGTAAYMAPEQARGHTVDRRADLWAFGCVLFEMLAGRRAFEGDTVSDTIAAVLTREPEWTALPATTPTALRRLLRRCLVKQASRRLDSAAAARLEIDDADSPEPVAPRPAPQRAWPAALAFALGGLLTGFVMWAGSRPAVDAPLLTSRFEILPPRTRSLALSYSDRTVALSPDGRSIVYRTGGTLRQLVVHPIDRTEGAVLPGIVDARWPFLSPDGRWIGYFDGSGLKRVPTAGGASVTIGAVTGDPLGASWGEDGTIVFATASAPGLQRVSAGGGEPVSVTTANSTNGESHRHPSVLPGGRGVLFTVWKGSYRAGTAVAQVAVVDARTGQHRVLIEDGAQAAYVDGGAIVYLAGGALRAIRFDLDRLEVVGAPVPLAENPWIGAQADFAVSRSGTVVYIPAHSAERLLVWVDRTGQETSIPAPPRLYEDVRLSPDGTRVALAIRDQENDIWLWDFRRGGPLTRLTFNPRVDERPVWTPDGHTVVFGSLRDASVQQLYAQAADGTGSVERLTTGSNGHMPAFVAEDGSVLGVEYNQGPNIAWFRITRPRHPSANSVSGSASSHVEPLINTTAAENNPDVSPDGRYVAYQSNESGRFEIWVRPLPRVDAGQWQVSTEGGTRPIWGRDGKALFFLDAANRLTAVSVQLAANAFVHGRPVTVFNAAYVEPYDTEARPFDVAPDGRFLMVKENATARLAVVVNAIEELKAKVAIP